MNDSRFRGNASVEIDVLIRARYPIISIVSHEEGRVEDAIRRLVDGKKQVLTWSATEPFNALDKNAPIPLDGLTQALEALNFALVKVRQEQTRTVFILRDFDPYLDNAVIVRRLRDLAHELKRSYSTLIFLSPVLAVPTHLEKEIVVVDYDLPHFDEINDLLGDLIERVQGNPNIHIELGGGAREALVQAALGLTADEASNVFNKTLVLNGRLDEADIDVVLAEKKQIIRKTGALEFYEANAHFSDIGGLHSLKGWLSKRADAWGEKAREYGLPAPRGVLLLGVPGCGKSLTARAIGAQWKLPLLRFDVGAIFGKYVGESEANLRRALNAAETIAPCVLWIDELEKAFSVSRGDDGGTTLRIFGGFLSWLQEKKSPVFVVGTANNIDQLPPELLRRGRLDEIFFVDLPDERERRAIFNIHLRKRGREPEEFDIEKLVESSNEYSGAEIEGAIVSAMYDAFDEQRDVTTDDIWHNLQAMVSLSRTMSEEITRLRDWASSRARPAS